MVDKNETFPLLISGGLIEAQTTFDKFKDNEPEFPLLISGGLIEAQAPPISLRANRCISAAN